MAGKNRKTQNGKGQANSTKLARCLGESASFEAPVDHFGLLLKPSWNHFGPSWVPLGLLRANFGPLGVIGVVRGEIGGGSGRIGEGSVGPSWAILGALEAILEPSWGNLGPL